MSKSFWKGFGVAVAGLYALAKYAGHLNRPLGEPGQRLDLTLEEISAIMAHKGWSFADLGYPTPGQIEDMLVYMRDVLDTAEEPTVYELGRLALVKTEDRPTTYTIFLNVGDIDQGGDE